MKKLIHTVHKKHFAFTKRETALFFLGIGLALFILNMVSMLNMLDYLVEIKNQVSQPFLGFYVSTLASVILMAYSLFNMHEEK